ncbi:ArsR family transcriptional regulator [Massilia sp. W12]|uniref:ArsR family transcriptional regulator n=1 Tax=Massilia sp. W12 TaxID=3126507 RepID=UPI0030D1DDA0
MQSEATTTPEANNTSVAARRIQNLLNLIEHFQTHEMILDEVAEFLGFTRSGAQKYVQTLRDAGVIELARHIEGNGTSQGKAVYRIGRDPEKINEFRTGLTQPKKAGAGQNRRKAGAEHGMHGVPMAGEGRQFHILADDTHYAIRLHRAPVQRDPLVEAFFGAPKTKSSAVQ